MSVIDLLLQPRAAAGGSTSNLLQPEPWLMDQFAGPRVAAGVRVSPEAALSLGTYFACLRALSEDEAKIPLGVFEALEVGPQKRGKRLLQKHRVTQLVGLQPNEEMGAIAFRETLTHHAMGWGGGFAEIEREIGGEQRPLALWPIHPSRVQIWRDPQTLLLWYRVWADERHRDKRVMMLRPENVFHVHGLGWDGLQGYSIAQLGAQDFGVGLAQQQYAAAFYGNNTQIGGVLQHPKKLGKDGLRNLRRSWRKKYGGPARAFTPAILEEGMEWKPTSIPNRDAQFIEALKLGVVAICRWFRVPPHKVASLDRATFSNIEQQALEYVNDALMPWLVRWEQEIARKLLTPAERLQGMHARHITRELLRGDSVSRAAFHRTMVNISAMSPNDVRDEHEYNPVEDPAMDGYYLQTNMGPTTKIFEGTLQPTGAQTVNDPDADDTPGDDSGQAPDVPDDGSDAAVLFEASAASQLPVFLEAATRVARREANAVKRAATRFDGDGEGFDAWADTFFARSAAIVVEIFTPPLQALVGLAEGLGLENPDAAGAGDAALDAFARTFAEQGRATPARSTPPEPFAEQLAGAVMAIAERLLLPETADA